LVYSIYDSTEVAIQKMIESCKSMIDEEHNSSVVNRDFKLKIKTLENAPRDPDKLKRLLQSKEREKEEAVHIEDTQRLVTEIEMLKVVFCV
jgi:tRNA A37 N6-isopentenylltransferase MiaA